MLNSRQRSGKHELGTISRSPTASTISEPLFFKSVHDPKLRILLADKFKFSIFFKNATCFLLENDASKLNLLELPKKEEFHKSEKIIDDKGKYLEEKTLLAMQMI